MSCKVQTSGGHAIDLFHPKWGEPKQNPELHLLQKLYLHNFLQQYKTLCTCTVEISPTNLPGKHRNPVLQDKGKYEMLVSEFLINKDK